MEALRIKNSGVCTAILALLLGVCAFQSGAVNYTWANVGTDWSVSANWGVGSGYPGSSGTADAAIFSAAATTQPNIGVSVTIGRVTSSTGSGSHTISSSDASKILTVTGTSTGVSSPINCTPASVSLTITAPLVFGAASGTQTINANSATGPTTVNLSGSVSNTSAITIDKSGPGLLNLNGNNTFTAPLTISAGTVRLGHANALGTTAGGATVGASGTLDLNGQTISGEALTLTGVLTNTGGSAGWSGAVALNTGALVGTAGAIELSGDVSGVNPLIKNGAGTLILSATTSYTGNTTVSNGTLIVNGSTTGSSAVTVRNGATLGGTGTLGGSVTCDSGAFGLFTNGVTLTISGGLTLNNNTVKLNLSNNVPVGTYTLATYGGSLSGAFAGTPAINTGSFAENTTNYITTGGGNVVLHVATVAAPSSTNTTTTVASSLNPSYLGQSVTFTATIAPALGSVVPTGSIQFKTNGVNLGSPVTVTTGSVPNGTAVISASGLPVATHTVTAEFTGTGNFNGSSGTLSGGQTVAAVPATFTWTNVASGNWSTAANWSPSGPPFNAIAQIDNCGTANVTANAPYPVTNLRVGYGTGGTVGTLNIGANLTVTAASEVGRSGNGAVNITNGILQFTGATTTTFRLGVLAAGTGTGTQSGGTVMAAGTVSIGVNGNGSYSLTNGLMLASNNFTVASGLGGIGTLTQSGGSLTVGSILGGSGLAWVGQQGAGVFNLSGGTFTATSLTIGASAGSSGTINQTGGAIDLLNGPQGAGELSVGGLGTAVYSIANGICSANSMTVASGTLTVKPGSIISLTGGLTLGVAATNNFIFGAAGVSGITAGAVATVDSSATINVDGSAYAGGVSNFTLINAPSFAGVPVINLLGFASGASATWNAGTGNFIVTTTTGGTVLTRPGGNNPSAYGDPVTFQAVVSPAPLDGRAVTFYDGFTPIGTGTTVGGVAAFTTSTLAFGTHSLTAGFAGDATHNASASSALTHTVDLVGNTSTVLTRSVGSNPSAYGDPLTFRATVSPALPDGRTVTFYDGGTPIGTDTTVSGVATFTTSTLALGAHSIKARYAGDATHNASTSAIHSHTVDAVITTSTVLTRSGGSNPSLYGDPLTFRATISPGLPDGKIITFYDGGTLVGTGATVDGVATLTTLTLAVGAHSLTAVYAGDVTHTGSTSSALAQTVNSFPGITRVAMMPNLPSPFLMRNWKAVTTNYDSFVFDYGLTGQYLPLIKTNAQNPNFILPFFGLPSYVGVTNYSQPEAINAIAAVLGASLVGIDKSNQGGTDWVRMMIQYFNHTDGLDVLGNGSRSKDSSFWYQLLPHILFIGLVDRYPATAALTTTYRSGSGGASMNDIFYTVAQRWCEACRGMGAASNTAPNFNWYGYSFVTNAPIAGQDHIEPEGAAGVAWLEYMAWRQFGQTNANFLQAADWSLQFMQNSSANVLYEVLVPYGALAAARMNAELGRSYNVSKFMNWCFDPTSPSRSGWGVISDTWNGNTVHGLAGSTTDGGGYAFAMNGFEQAAGLAPVARYDQRYAHDLGKWLLNFANNSRLFYSTYVAANHQSCSAWLGGANDFIPYEGLHKTWNGTSLYAAGDALRNGWAGTDYALYGGSHVGMLAALVGRTSNEKILQIDLLATDYFKDANYPTYLYYNPYTTNATFTVNHGAAPCDLLNIVTEQFLRTNVSGSATLTLPPDTAAVVVVLPANARLGTAGTRMYANGRIVNYQYVGKDTDGDGLPDWWETRYYGNLTDASPTGIGANGRSNLASYLLGVSPTVANVFNPQFRLQPVTGYPELTWNTIGGKTYGVYVANQLGGAADFQSVYTVTETNATAGITGSQTYMDSFSAFSPGTSNRFYRVKLEQ